MGRAFFVFFLFGFEILSSAQPAFLKTFGADSVNDIGQSIIQTPDGGFVIAGTQFTTGNHFESLFLIRTDSSGDTLWTRLINETFNKYTCRGVQQTFDGGYILTGIKGNASLSVPFLLKTDTSGIAQWSCSFEISGYDHLNAVQQTADSGFIATGDLYGGNQCIFIVRTDKAGDTLWTKCYCDSTHHTVMYSIHPVAEGGWIAAGIYQDMVVPDVDVCLLRIDTAGNVLWVKAYGGPDYEYGQQVLATPDGGFIIAATTYSYGAGLADYYLVKTDSLGDVEWSRTYGGFSDDRSESVVLTPDGGYLVCGESASFSAGNFDIFLVRTDSAGDTLWTRVLNSPMNSEAYSLTKTNDGGFALTGTYLNPNFKNDVLLIKMDTAGWMGCGESSSNTTVTSPATTDANQHLVVYPTGTIISNPFLLSGSGADVATICIPDRVEEQDPELTIGIYPVPAGKSIRVSGHFLPGCNLSIFDSFGRIVFETKLPEDRHIHLPGLIPGIYFVLFDKPEETVKLVVY